MRLKSLEVYGFKSFADRLKFEFGDGMTAIVGPNGCGKSNVFEALRWVLGEQSAKAIRGDEMNDVIFKGTDKRKALGYCEVVVTFDNTDRTLPIDSDDVSIGRRLYRKMEDGSGGEAEYFINKELCRLKDVREMLMDTGIGTSSYCFIAQGQIARLLEANPKERRAVFEEAAGISRYRKRRDKVVGRLERVRRDLETLANVREEVDKRYRTLKGQAATARRYKRHQDDLKGKRARLSLIDYRELLERKTEIDVEIAALREREAAAAAKAVRADVRVRESETEDSGLDRSASEAESLRSSAAVEAERLETEIRNATQVARDAEEEIAPLKAEISDIHAQVDESSKELKGLEETKREIESDRESANEIIEALKRAASEASEHAGALAAEAKAQGDEAYRSAQARAEARNRLASAQSEHQGAGARADKLGSRLAGIDESHEAARAKAEEARGDCVRLTDGLATAARETSRQKTRLEELEAERARLADEIADGRAEFESLKTRLMLLEDLHRRGDGVPAGTRELVKASRDPKSKLGEIHGVVGNLLWAAPEVRIAIETALGGRASDLLVDSVATAKRAIDHLCKRDLGRASFLPLDTMLPTLLIADEFLTEDGVVGRASDLVRHEERFGLAVEYLLGRVLIVRDRETATRMVSKTGAGTRIVTLDGEIVDGCGPVRGGVTTAAHLGLLGRKAEIARLRVCVGELKEGLAAMGAKRVAADEESVRRRRLLESHVAEVRGIERAAAKAGTEKDSLAKEAKRLEAERLEAAAELDETARDRDVLAGEIGELSAQLEKLEVAEREAKAKAEELAAGIEEAKVDSARREKEYTDRRTSFAGLEEKAKGIARNFEQLERELARTREALRARGEDLDRADARAKEHRGAAGSMQEQMIAKRAELEMLAASAATARARRDELIAERDSVRATAHEAKAEHQEAQTALNELRLDEREVTLKISGLEEITSNELGISLAELAAEPEAPEENPEAAQAEGDEAAQLDDAPSDDAQLDVARLDEALNEATNSEHSAEEELQPVAEMRVTDTNAAESVEPSAGDQAESDDEAASDEEEVAAGPVDPDTLRSEIRELRRKIDRMGRVNMFALEELDEFAQKRDFYRTQHEDLAKARTSLNDVINRINKRTKAMFQETFDAVRGHFQQHFRKLFRGGKADIFLDIGEDGDILEAGIEIMAKPPGREALKLSLLSGGQRALTTIALLFAIFRAKPSPFCVLDEVDAPLDDANVERFCDMLEEHCATTQFIVVTHHKATMEHAKKLYGITMQEHGVSLKLPVKLEDIGTTIKVEASKDAVAAQDGPFSRVSKAA